MTFKQYKVALLAALPLFSGITLVTIGGCGGNHQAANSSAVQQTGRAELTVRWPERTRLVPFASESILVRLVRGNTILGDRLLTRPANGGLTSAVFERLPTGGVTVQAFAFPTANGSGIIQAQGSVPATVVGGQTTTVKLTLGTTIDRVELTPASPTLTVGQTAALTLTARTAAGEVVLTSPAKIDWAVSSPAASVLGGNVSALAAGIATVTATETESGKSASVTVQVKAPSGPVQDAPIYDGFDYTPGTDLAGLNGGKGFISPWLNSRVDVSATVVSGSLTYGNLATTGNSFKKDTFNPTGSERRYGSLPTMPGTVRYWSILARPETISGGYPGPFFGFLVGNRFFGKPSNEPTFGIAIEGNGQFADSGLRPQAGVTYFFVMRITYGETNDTFDFFLNPTPGQPLPATPTVSQVLPHNGTPDQGRGFDASVPTVFDELRVGSTWESVSPVVVPGG